MPMPNETSAKPIAMIVYGSWSRAGAGNFPGGRDFVFNLKNKGQDVGKISPRVPKAFIAQMNARKAQIISGKIKVPSKL